VKYFVDILSGNITSEITTYKHHTNEFFGAGKEKNPLFWNAVLRQVIVAGLVGKEIESYGTLFLREAGEEFISNPKSFMLIKEHNYSDTDDSDIVLNQKGGRASDEVLFKILKDLRKEIAKGKGVPPFVVFQDPSLEDMTLQYPISIEELQNVVGVGQGKAKRYGQPFLDVIIQYVDENDIERPEDFVVKSIVNKSGSKVSIIRNIDKKLPLEDIAKAQGKKIDELITEIEAIVASGTKINIDYHLNEILDEDAQEEIFEYFMDDADTDSIEAALIEFDEDYTEEELKLMRIKFMSEVAN
jgi:ATP-dependent DNA helicase RecQ